MTTPAPTVTRYRFPGPDGGWWLGLRPLPMATLAAVVTVTVLALYAGAPLPIGMAVLMTGALAAVVPVADRTAVEWVPAAARSTARRLSGRHKWRAANALRPARAGAAVTRMPACFGGQRVLDVDGLGVIDDPASGSSVGVLDVAGGDRFALSEPAEQARLLDAWGTVLAALAADPRVARVQLLERAVPEDRDPGEWLRERADISDRPAAAENYLQLVRDVAVQATRREVLFAVALHRGGGVHATADGLTEVATRLLTAGLAGRPLTAAELTDRLRQGLDGPGAVGAGDRRLLGPVSTVESWEQLRTDDCWHRGFAVTGWPRLPLTAGWFEPLLLAAPGQVARTVSVHLEPVPAGEAMRRARAARSRARLDAADRQRLGLVDSARLEADAAEAAAAEEELVAGYRLHRLAAAITVSAPSLPLLDDAARAVRTAAQTARLELRPLHGQHLLALRTTLPLCRADRRHR